MEILDHKTEASKSAEWERLRRELLRRIVKNEAERRNIRPNAARVRSAVG